MKRKNHNSQAKKRHIPRPSSSSSTSKIHHVVECGNGENISPFDDNSSVASPLKKHHRTSGIPIAIGSVVTTSPLISGGGAASSDETLFDNKIIGDDIGLSSEEALVDHVVSFDESKELPAPAGEKVDSCEAAEESFGDDDQKCPLTNAESDKFNEDDGEDEVNLSLNEISILDDSSVRYSLQTTAVIADCHSSSSLSSFIDENNDASIGDQSNSLPPSNSNIENILNENNESIGTAAAGGPVSITELAVEQLKFVIPKLENKLQDINLATYLYGFNLWKTIKCTTMSRSHHHKMPKPSSTSSYSSQQDMRPSEDQNFISVLFFAVLSFFLAIIVKTLKKFVKKR